MYSEISFSQFQNTSVDLAMWKGVELMSNNQVTSQPPNLKERTCWDVTTLINNEHSTNKSKILLSSPT